MPFNPFTILTSKIFAALAALFLTGFVTQTIRIEGFWFVVGLKEQNAVLRLDLSKIQAAQLVSADLAEERKQRDQAAFDSLAERTNHAEKEIAQLRTAADAYARSHRVRPQAAGGASRRSGGSGATSASEGGDGSGDASGVVVSKPDFDTLVTNSIRLKQVHDWGEGLVAAGLATSSE